MAEQEERVFKPSVTSGISQLGEQHRYLPVTKTGHKTKFKWLGEIEELKSQAYHPLFVLRTCAS